MLLQIGQKPESDFHHPIGMLEDCHKRILYFLKSLIRAVTEADAQAIDPEHRVTLEKALRYFRESAPRHTADEEESLFPRLRRIDAPEIEAVFRKIDRLENEHRWADQQHLEADTICRRWLETGSIPKDDRERLKTILSPLVGFYEQHIRMEEAEVFTAARNLITDAEKEAIGGEMARRRGLTMCGASINTDEIAAPSTQTAAK